MLRTSRLKRAIAKDKYRANRSYTIKNQGRIKKAIKVRYPFTVIPVRKSNESPHASSIDSTKPSYQPRYQSPPPPPGSPLNNSCTQKGTDNWPIKIEHPIRFSTSLLHNKLNLFCLKSLVITFCLLCGVERQRRVDQVS